jgi:hypothetical protein
MGSIGLYVAAFFFPEIHRKPDFIWGGVGLFYALALWIYAKEMSGGILVGQAASVALLGWFGWQTVKLRQLVPIDWQTAQPINKKPERSNPKAVTTPATKDPQSTGKKSSSRATTPTIDRQSPPPPAVESAPKSTAERFPIAPNRSAQKPAPSNPIEPAIELEEQAWIRLEVKPAPDSTSLVKEVVRSESSAKPQPTPENIQPLQQSRQPLPSAPTSAQPTPTPAVQPPSPPPATSHKPESVTEVITVSFPTPVDRSPTQPSAPLSPSPATNPLQTTTPTPKSETTASPPPTTKSDSPKETLRERVPPEQTGDLNKLIAELESET